MITILTRYERQGQKDKGTMHRLLGLSIPPWGILSVSVLIAGVFMLTSPAMSRELYEGKLAFDIMRGDNTIGRHVLTFQQVDDETHVDIEVSIQVKIGFLTVFRYSHTNREVWRGGRPLSVTTDTDDNGTPFEVRAEKRDDGFYVQTLAEESLLTPAIIPTSYWNSAILKNLRWFDTQRGILLEIGLEEGDIERVSLANGESIEARRYDVTGDLNQTLWYTPQGEWVKLVFAARGADIEYILTEGYAGKLPTQSE